MNLAKNIKGLCTPSFVYFIMSILLILVTIFSSSRSKQFKKFNSLFIMMIIVKLIYVLFWTWILNLICKSGHPNISWLLVLFPFIFIFLVMLSMKINK